jgi:hypothetical protein
MNNVDELKEFAAVHARAQRIPRARYEELRMRITHDGEGPGSWTGEWSRAGEQAERAGDLLDACRLYTMARFPFVDGDARRQAWERAVAAFDRWREREGADLRPLDVDLDGGTIRGWTTGATRPGAPFVILMGGIVSTKEQWAPTLLRLPRLGAAGIVAEMPGVGANTLPYDENAWRMFPALLDAVGVPAGARNVYAMTMRFSGHLALRWSLTDARVRSVLTVGAPVRGVFADAAWQRALPRVTVDTLAHLTGAKADELGARLRGWELTDDQLAALEVALSYVASRRDEIIPADDISLLRRHVRRLSLLENDDVHGSPRYVGLTGLWLTRALLRDHGSRPAQRVAIGGLAGLLRAHYAMRGAMPGAR